VGQFVATVGVAGLRSVAANIGSLEWATKTSAIACHRSAFGTCRVQFLGRAIDLGSWTGPFECYSNSCTFFTFFHVIYGSDASSPYHFAKQKKLSHSDQLFSSPSTSAPSDIAVFSAFLLQVPSSVTILPGWK
jgi:hypothetical protein